MIQRIQSVFLLLASGATFGLFGLPFASTPDAITSSTIFGDAIFNLQDHIALLVLFGLAGLLALVAIFLFKNRKLQTNLGRFALIANVIGLVLAIILFMQDKATLGAVDPSDEAGLYMPFIAVVFLGLALRFIAKDENLVKSMDRLR